MILHTLNQGPGNPALLEDCLAAMTATDTLLLIEDGIYWSLPAYADTLTRVPGRVQALESDLTARGIKTALTTVDDTGFVELTINHDKVVSWF
ncbi:MAG: sulfurtransferase complex subunit TusB [Oceanospirillaceae bacterium]|jgi:tRNA 2-thiouridine synthesizing protein B|nr:sulfurtransferase complex subunit TusB [Oceanospirillaceae bacterium]